MNTSFRCAFGVVALTAVSACATVPSVPTKGEAVSLRAVLAENKGRPFGCGFFDPASDTCFGIAQYQINGNSGVEIGQASLPNSQGSYLEFRQPFVVQDGRVCADPKKMQITPKGPTAPGTQLAINLARKSFESKGEICDTYYRAEGGGYVVESVGRNGKRAGPATHMTFFAERKALRTRP